MGQSTIIEGGLIFTRENTGLAQPILVGETRNSRELALVIADDGVFQSKGLSGDQQIVSSYRSASFLKARTEHSVAVVGWRLKR